MMPLHLLVPCKAVHRLTCGRACGSLLSGCRAPSEVSGVSCPDTDCCTQSFFT